MKIKTITVGFLATNCYIVYEEKTLDALVIDPGDRPEKILPELRGLNVKYVVLTHAHFDHVGAIDSIIEATGAKLAAHELERKRLSDAYLACNEHSFTPHVADILLHEGDVIGTLRVIHTPGHTEGSICLASDDVMFTGDTLFHNSIGRCDFPGGDYEQMLKSLERLKALTVNYRLLPGHGEETTLDRERAENPFLRT